jgi:peptide/nickel transport system substrate-binding protein
MVGDIPTLDGHNPAGASIDTVWGVYDRLTAYDLARQPQPQLAESWDTSSDFRQLKLTLRQGVQFHSGRDFTSDDVKYNLLRVRDPQVQLPTLRTQSNWFTAIDTPDKNTVLLSSEVPRPLAFDMFEYFNILDKDTMEGPAAKTTAIGTGPFKFVEWVQGDHLAFAGNSAYWQSGKPYLSQLLVQVAKDPAAMAVQFESGSLDVIKTPSLLDLKRYAADSRYQAILHPGSGNFYLFGNNLAVPPLDNKQVRQALSYAIDRQRFVQDVLLGFGDARALPWPSFSPAYDASKTTAYAFDLERARSLLVAAGVTNAQFDLNVQNTFPELLTFAQIYQADLGKLGIGVNVRALDGATWADEAVNRRYQGQYLAYTGFVQLEPASALANSRGLDPVANIEGFQDSEYQQLSAAAASEPDANKRKEAYARINDIVLDAAFVMMLGGVPVRLASQANVHGIRPLLHDTFAYDAAWLD